MLNGKRRIVNSISGTHFNYISFFKKLRNWLASSCVLQGVERSWRKSHCYLMRGLGCVIPILWHCFSLTRVEGGGKGKEFISRLCERLMDQPAPFVNVTTKRTPQIDFCTPFLCQSLHCLGGLFGSCTSRGRPVISLLVLNTFLWKAVWLWVLLSLPLQCSC